MGEIWPNAKSNESDPRYDKEENEEESRREEEIKGDKPPHHDG